VKAHILVPVLSVALLASGCEAIWHDAFGPAERLARTLFNGWDMWQTPAVRPYEDPMPGIPAGAVQARPAAGPLATFETARHAFDALDGATRTTGGAQAYRRFCHHCHGESGDGRIIVGESFDVAPRDLRSDDVQDLDDEDVFEVVRDGSGAMLALHDTLTPLEVLLAIRHMRGLKGAPSRPFYPPQATIPLK